MSLVAGTAVLALIIACVSIVFSFWKSPPEVLRRVTQLEVDLMEGLDTLSRWMKRENVRRAREQKEDAPGRIADVVLPVDTGDRKAQLRAIARSKGLKP